MRLLEDGTVLLNTGAVDIGQGSNTALTQICAEALKLLEKFHELLTTDSAISQDLGKLVVFCGVRDYPARVKCATLAWHTLKSALTTELTEPVSTE